MPNMCCECAQLVGVEQGDPELLGVTASQGKLGGSLYLHLECVECGEVLGRAMCMLELDIAHTCWSGEYEVEDCVADAWSHFGLDKHGRVSKRSVHFYGARITAHLGCPICHDEFTVRGGVEIPASQFTLKS